MFLKILSFFKLDLIPVEKKEFSEVVLELTELIDFSNEILFSDIVWILGNNGWKGQHSFETHSDDEKLLSKIHGICKKNKIVLFVCPEGALFISLHHKNSEFIRMNLPEKIDFTKKKSGYSRYRSVKDLDMGKFSDMVSAPLLEEQMKRRGLFILVNVASNHELLEIQEKYGNIDVNNMELSITKQFFLNKYFLVFKDDKFNMVFEITKDQQITPWGYYNYFPPKNNNPY